jgi:hypothetical protein
MIDGPSSYPATRHGAELAGFSARDQKPHSWPRRFADFLAMQTEILRGDDFLVALPARRAMTAVNPGLAQRR